MAVRPERIPTLAGDETVLKCFLAEAKATMRLTHERIRRTNNFDNLKVRSTENTPSRN